MNNDIRLQRILSNSDSKRLSVHDYAVALKLSGFTMDEAIDRVERMAISDRVRLVYVQTAIVLKVYLDDSIKKKNRKYRMLPKEHTEEEWEAKKEQYGHKCFYCNKASKLTKDHVIPVSLGGSNGIDNIVPACWTCNYKKRARRIEYFKEGSMLKLL